MTEGAQSLSSLKKGASEKSPRGASMPPRNPADCAPRPKPRQRDGRGTTLRTGPGAEGKRPRKSQRGTAGGRVGAGPAEWPRPDAAACKGTAGKLPGRAGAGRRPRPRADAQAVPPKGTPGSTMARP